MKQFSSVGVSCIIGDIAIEKIVENRRACQKGVCVAIAIDGIGVGVRATQNDVLSLLLFLDAPCSPVGLENIAYMACLNSGGVTYLQLGYHAVQP